MVNLKFMILQKLANIKLQNLHKQLLIFFV
jgi:hypothetical protein